MQLTGEQLQLRDVTRGFLAGLPGVRAAMENPDGDLAAGWSTVVEEQGWPAYVIPEDHDGWGFGFGELAVVLEELGRTLTGVPLLATTFATSALLTMGSADQRATWLPRLAGGETGCVAFSSGVTARRTPDGFVLHGVARRVLDGHSAALVLLDTPVGMFLVDRAALTAEVSAGLDPTRRLATLTLDGVAVAEDARLPGAGRDAFEARCLTALAAEQVGVADACLEMGVAYAKIRRQFGKPIGSFQAIQHMLADLLVHVESARSAVLAAAIAVDADDDAITAARVALLQASRAAFRCAADNIQVHGGIGFTWEHDAHLFLKRARANQDLLASPAALTDALADGVLGGASPFPTTGETPELAAYRQRVRAWLADNLTGEFAALKGRGWTGDMDGAVDARRAWERRLHEGGWTGIAWPVEHGGQGASLAEEVIFHEEYARADAPGRVGHIGEGLLAPTLIAFGDAAQQERFLPGILDGSALWCQGYSEPEAGSDLANVQCKAELVDGEWVITGQKVWTSLAEFSEWCFVVCRTDPDAARKHDGISYLLVPMNQDGVHIVPIRQITGSSEFAEVFFDGARTAADNVVGPVHGGWKVAMGTLAFERGASTLGQQIRFANELSEVIAAAQRTGSADEARVRARLVDAWVGLRVMRLNALRVLGAHMSGTLSREALITKLVWATWHQALGELALDVLGGEALTEGGPLERLFLWTRCDTIYAGTNEIQRTIIARRGLGLPR